MHGKTNRASAVHLFTTQFNSRKYTAVGVLVAAIMITSWLTIMPRQDERDFPDVAEAAFFLASDAASFISGTYLVVDGAMTTAGH